MRTMKRISLFKEFGKNVVTRTSVQVLFDKVTRYKSTSLIMDFSDVEFISRSCVHEYLKQKKKSKKHITEEHVPDVVKQMMKIVDDQMKTKKAKVKFIKLHSVTTI